MLFSRYRESNREIQREKECKFGAETTATVADVQIADFVLKTGGEAVKLNAQHPC